MKLRLVEKDGSVEWVDHEGDTLPESILVKAPFMAILGSRYRLEWPQLRSYRYVGDALLPRSAPPDLTNPPRP